MKNGIIVLIALITLGFGANAQNSKLAHVDYMAVIDSLPSKLAADKEIQSFLDEGEKTLMEMQTEYQRALNDYLGKQDSLSAIMKELKEKQLMEQQEIIRIKNESLQQDLQVLNDRAYKPIEDKLKKAIAIVAERHGIVYVLESSSLLYIGEGKDLTKEVKAEMMKMEGK